MSKHSPDISATDCVGRLLISAARMNRLPTGRLGSEIAAVLEDMARILAVDGVLLCELSGEGKSLSPLHASPPPDSSLGRTCLALSQLPFLLERLKKGEALEIASLPEYFSEHGIANTDFPDPADIRSILMVPIPTDRPSEDVLTLFRFRPEPWPEELVACAMRAGDFFSSVLCRMKTALVQEELLPIEELLNEISSVYINLPFGDIEQVVNHDLGRLSRLIGADRYAICLAENIRRDSPEIIFSFDYWPGELREQIEAEHVWLMAHGGHSLFAYITDRCLKGETVVFRDPDEIPESEFALRDTMGKLGIKSQLAVPISADREVIGFMIIHTTRACRLWSEDLIRKVRQFGDLFANAYVRKRSEEARRAAHEEIKRLKARIESDYRYLSGEFMKAVGGESIFGSSVALNRVVEQILQVAPTQTPVLLLGETGVGKGMLARALHQASRRGIRPLVQLNCATLAPGLIESELFGHERGAFTGADRQRAGRFEIAEGTTLFLDEIGELPQSLQAKLLRVLETGEYERLGGSKTLKTDARIIAATNRDLEREVEEGRFRRDLWYRLSIFPIRIPPLRERSEDIPAIAEGFVERFALLSGKRFNPIPKEVMTSLMGYPWPGNVRELRNLIERAVIVSPPGDLCITLPKHPASPDCAAIRDEVKPFADMERSYLLHALRQAGWRIEGPGGAAALLGLNASTLRSRMRKLGIRKAAALFE